MGAASDSCPLTACPMATRLGPQGDSIIYDSTPFHSTSTLISEVTADGGSPTALLTLSGGFMPAFSPDGSQIAYSGLGSAPGAAGIFIADADGTHPRQLTSRPKGRERTCSRAFRRMARASCSGG